MLRSTVAARYHARHVRKHRHRLNKRYKPVPQKTYSIGTTTSAQTHKQVEFKQDTADTGKLITIASLITKYPYGRLNRNLSFTSEVTFHHVLIHLLKSSYLTRDETKPILDVHPLYNHMATYLYEPQYVDFAPLRKFDTDYDNQTSIPTYRTCMLRDLALKLCCHIPSVIRYLGQDYMGVHLPRASLLHKLKDIVEPDLFDDIKRVLYQGSPAKLHGHSTRANFLEYKRYGNHASLTKDVDRSLVTLNKE